MAYEVSCSTNSTGGPSPFIANPINGTFAEPRGAAAGTAGTPVRFHAGTDIQGQCRTDRIVYPIEAGTVQVTDIPACTNTGDILCIRVIGNSGRIFDYVHVDWTSTGLDDNSPVTPSTPLGTIQNATVEGDHLHLNQVVRTYGYAAPTYRVNPQFPLRLEFTDTDTPAFGYATVGTVSNRSVILVKDRTSTPFELRDNVQYVSGSADVLVTASANRSGSLYRKGLHKIGTNAFPMVSQTVSNPQSQLMFDTLPDGFVSSTQVQRIYYYQQTNAID